MWANRNVSTYASFFSLTIVNGNPPTPINEESMPLKVPNDACWRSGLFLTASVILVMLSLLVACIETLWFIRRQLGVVSSILVLLLVSSSSLSSYLLQAHLFFHLYILVLVIVSSSVIVHSISTASSSSLSLRIFWIQRWVGMSNKLNPLKNNSRALPLNFFAIWLPTRALTTAGNPILNANGILTWLSLQNLYPELITAVKC